MHPLRAVFASAAFMFVLPLVADAQTVWTFASEYPATNISGVGLTTFAQDVTARTKGAVTVVTKLNDEL